MSIHFVNKSNFFDTAHQLNHFTWKWGNMYISAHTFNCTLHRRGLLWLLRAIKSRFKDNQPSFLLTGTSREIIRIQRLVLWDAMGKSRQCMAGTTCFRSLYRRPAIVPRFHAVQLRYLAIVLPLYIVLMYDTLWLHVVADICDYAL